MSRAATFLAIIGVIPMIVTAVLSEPVRAYEAVVVDVVPPDTLNLRAAPNKDATILAELPRGTRVRIIESFQDGWKKIVVDVIGDTGKAPPQPLHGFVNGRYLVSPTREETLQRSAFFGPWQFSSGVGSRGTPYCLIRSMVSNKDIGQNVVIKGFREVDKYVIDLYKDTWNRPAGLSLNVMFDFLDNTPLTLSAYADAHILDIEIPTPAVGAFLLQVANRPALQVIFPDGNEPTWIIQGENSKAAVQRLILCMRR